ncbi:MAG: hypothetical protein RLZZ135_318 [Cyanobacteriota bacterium]|jgi:hypothetical protein
MIFRIFLNRMIFTLCGVPMAFACLGFFLMPLYQKPLNQLTAFEMSLTGTDEETHQLAINHDYIGFALHRMMAGIPSAIGGGLAVSGVDVARQKKKKKELDDKN